MSERDVNDMSLSCHDIKFDESLSARSSKELPILYCDLFNHANAALVVGVPQRACHSGYASGRRVDEQHHSTELWLHANVRNGSSHL